MNKVIIILLFISLLGCQSTEGRIINLEKRISQRKELLENEELELKKQILSKPFAVMQDVNQGIDRETSIEKHKKDIAATKKKVVDLKKQIEKLEVELKGARQELEIRGK